MSATPEDGGPRILLKAMDAARALGIPYVAPEHVLLACLEHPSEMLRDLLASKGIDRATLRGSILARARRGSEAVSAGQMPIAPSVKRALERSLEEAQLLRQRRIDVAHLFLGLLGDDGIAGEVLQELELRTEFSLDLPMQRSVRDAIQ